MSDFSAYKAVAVGLGAMLLATTVAPELTGGRFDLLRIANNKGGKTQVCPDGRVIPLTQTCPQPVTSSVKPGKAIGRRK